MEQNHENTHPVFKEKDHFEIKTFKGEVNDEFMKVYLVEDSNKDKFYTYNLNFKDIKKSDWKKLTKEYHAFFTKNLLEAGGKIENEGRLNNIASDILKNDGETKSSKGFKI